MLFSLSVTLTSTPTSSRVELAPWMLPGESAHGEGGGGEGGEGERGAERGGE